MDSNPSDYVSFGVAAGALLVAGVHAVRDVLAARFRELRKHGTGSRRRSAPAADSGGPAAGGRPDEQEGGSGEAEANPSPEQDKRDAPASPRGGNHDPEALDDTTRRTIAYLLIALLAVFVATLQAMVIFEVIAVGDVKEFNVILGPVVTLVTAAVSFYYGRRR